MNPTSYSGPGVANIFSHYRFRRGIVWGVIIIAALIAFEIFNYSTTEYALNDLLGDLTFFGIRWATILALAFCGIDFAGIARLFTPEENSSEPTEVWYLFGAWLLAATMNAMLTWWGVSIAILQHESLGNAVVARDMMLRIVPIFVAVMVWLIRVLIIGTFSVAGPRLFSQADQNVRRSRQPFPGRVLNERHSQHERIPEHATPERPASQQPAVSRPAAASSPAFRPAPKTPAQQPEPSYSRPEPTYHPVSMSPPSSGNNSGRTRQ
jgi:hypothetical protein